MVTVLGPSSVTATGPTGVSSRCVPGPIRPSVGQGHGHADRAVAAHAQIADVVEEDDAGRGGRIDRLEDQIAPTMTSEPRGSLTTAERNAS